MKKRIALFIGQLEQDYQSDIAKSIGENCIKYDFELDVFSEFGASLENFLHSEGECNIINLPDFSNYCGIVLASDTFDLEGMEEALVERLEKEVDYPVVSVRKEDPRFHSVLIDNYKAMSTMVEHMIVEHNYKDICFMTGNMKMQDARERYDGYMDTMARFGLPVDDSMIFYGDYWHNKGEEAVEFFLKDGRMPEAIVCANDYMCISVLKALESRHIKVPEQIALCAFDDVEEVAYTIPPISSMRMPCEAIGHKAVEMIYNMLQGKPVEKKIYLNAEPHFRKSCGCERENNEERKNMYALYQEKNRYEHALMQNIYMNVGCDNCNTVQELIYSMYVYSYNFAYNRIFVCLCKRDEDENEKLVAHEHYSENMELRAILTNGAGVEITEELFARRELLPAHYRKENTPLYYLPLHCKNHCIGYLAIEFVNIKRIGHFFHAWTLVFSGYLDKVTMFEENKVLKRFKELSVQDELTGLYNRRMLERQLQNSVMAFHKQGTPFFIISIDMDDLKYINDNFGHLEGDNALTDFAWILKSLANDRENIICARVGGDEFTMCVQSCTTEDILQLIQEIENDIAYLNSQNELELKPYTLAASIGFSEYRAGEPIVKCIKRADDDMYQKKAYRKSLKARK